MMLLALFHRFSHRYVKVVTSNMHLSGRDGQSGSLPPRKFRQRARKKVRRQKAILILGLFAFFAVALSAAFGLHDGLHLFRPSQPGPPTAPATDSDSNHPHPPVPPDTAATSAGARLMFVGDTMMDGNVAKVMEEKGDDYPLSQFMPLLQQADLVVANLETAVGTSRQLAQKTYAFQTDPARFALFEPLKGRILFSLANNHGMDAPLAETMTQLKRLGYPYIGVGQNRDEAFRPYVADINGIRLAVLGVSRVIPTVDWVAGDHHPGMASAYTDEPLLSTVQEWSRQVDHVIVFVHWGKEREHFPDDTQQELAQKLLDAGARLVIGAHPHVLQELRWTPRDHLVAFSLGNFVFTTSTDARANDTVVLDVTLTKERIAGVRIWPGRIHYGLVRRLNNDDPEGTAIQQRLNELSPTIHIDANGKVHPVP